ncbi:cation diffusion facilitator family transporter [Pelagibius litoralis]|uniref:cation diffusion facilitator family transporter n=1 Tax=Pelagibius litoralis TaxID=374515 RepID=UPI002AC32AAF|nr:cation diffusion facilitator family transporter [Pelagibius litoralis]
MSSAGTKRAAGPEAARLLRLATTASVATACILIVVKLIAFLLTDSVSVLSTLVDSLLDAAASIINLIAVRHALVPADREHRFGHGKAEPLAALGQAAFITGSAVFLIIEASQRFVSPRSLMNGDIGIAVMVFSILATMALVMLQRYVIRRTGSLAIKADSLHYVGDILVNAAVIVALVLTAQFGWRYIDPIFGLAIAAYILFNAWQISAGAMDMLMDRELPEDERARIREIALAHSSVKGLHDLRTRASGQQIFIQGHIEMDGALSLLKAHAIADEVEDELRQAFPGAEVILHQDPYGVEEERARFA